MRLPSVWETLGILLSSFEPGAWGLGPRTRTPRPGWTKTGRVNQIPYLDVWGWEAGRQWTLSPGDGRGGRLGPAPGTQAEAASVRAGVGTDAQRPDGRKAEGQRGGESLWGPCCGPCASPGLAGDCPVSTGSPSSWHHRSKILIYLFACLCNSSENYKVRSTFP